MYEALKIDCRELSEILHRVVEERLGEENTGVIDERIDLAEFVQGSIGDILGGRRIRDIAIDESQQV